MSEISEVQETPTETSDAPDSELESECDDVYDRMIEGKSKDELIAMREYLSGSDGSDSSEDEDPDQKVLTKTMR